MLSYQARRGPPIDGRCEHIAASTSVAFPENGLGTNIGSRERQGRRATRQGSTGLLGNLELHRPASLLLNDGRAIANSPASEHVIDPQPNEIATPQLAVDRQIEHRKITFATL